MFLDRCMGISCMDKKKHESSASWCIVKHFRSNVIPIRRVVSTFHSMSEHWSQWTFFTLTNKISTIRRIISSTVFSYEKLGILLNKIHGNLEIWMSLFPKRVQLSNLPRVSLSGITRAQLPLQPTLKESIEHVRGSLMSTDERDKRWERVTEETSRC